jgi:DNA-nicking Smr family endonuclease
MKLNLHKHTLEEAKDDIFSSLRKMITNKESCLEIIHGHIHGTKIRDYLDSIQFLQHCKQEGVSILSHNRHSNGGATTFTIEIISTSIS